MRYKDALKLHNEDEIAVKVGRKLVYGTVLSAANYPKDQVVLFEIDLPSGYVRDVPHTQLSTRVSRSR